ncbi:MAG TPA: anthranilate synthase component I [Planctomycetota bacterium]|nr:anthranilate synthase component I [Planctomycetota bacterium]
MSVTPDFQTFSELARKNPGKLIPVTRSFLADGITPVGAFRRMPPSDYAFLLESVERGERIGRYSFVGSAPEVIFRGHVLPQPGYTLERPGGASERHSGDPLLALEKYLAENAAIPAGEGVPVPPFSGGGVGYLGYDVIRLVEPRLNTPPSKAGVSDLPDLLVPIYRTILAFDHVRNTVTVVHHARADASPKAAYDAALTAIDNVIKHLRAASPEPLDEIIAPPAPATDDVKSNMTPDAYMRSVEKAKEYIAAGDIIQVVLSQRLSRETKAHPFEIYRSLRAINPSPYMFYLHFGKLHIVGSSPEVMVRVENGLITVRPIAGTRPRGNTPDEDAALAKDLLADPKERAEHVMLLDLGRNDVGRVADFASVKVTEQMIIEYYSHVMHIVSNVQGRMRKDLNAFKVFGSCFPAGTVSGAPKIRAMEIIDELEPDRRGAYAGAVGVVDFLGNLNTAIALRTFVIQEAQPGHFTAYLQAGAGIVADSVPRAEYDETMNKARGLLRALSAAEARLNAASQ